MSTAAIEAAVDAAFEVIEAWERLWGHGGRALRLVVGSYSNGAACASRWIRTTHRAVHAFVDCEGPGDSFEMTRSMNCVDGSTDINLSQWSHCLDEHFLDVWDKSMSPPVEVLDEALGALWGYLPLPHASWPGVEESFPRPLPTPRTSSHLIYVFGRVPRALHVDFYNAWYGYSFNHVSTPYEQLFSSRTAWDNTTLGRSAYQERLRDIREAWQDIETLEHLEHRGDTAYIRINACNDHGNTCPYYFLRRPVRALFSALYAGTSYGGTRRRRDVYYSSNGYYLDAQNEWMRGSSEPSRFRPMSRGSEEEIRILAERLVIPWVDSSRDVEGQVAEWVDAKLPKFGDEYSSSLFEYEEIQKYRPGKETGKARAIAALRRYSRDEIDHMIERRLG